jgi:hypothetical protein
MSRALQLNRRTKLIVLAVLGIILIGALSFFIFGRPTKPPAKKHLTAVASPRKTSHAPGKAVPATPAIIGDSLATEPDLQNQPGVLFFGGFEGQPWSSTMRPVLSPGNENFTINAGAGYNGSDSLHTFFRQGSYANDNSPAGTSATIFKIPFNDTGLNIGSFNNLYFRFMVRFQPGFEFGKSGKLPGLAGGADNAGGHPPNGYDGWSGRLDWVANGGLISYMYVPGIKQYGLELPWQVNGQSKLLQPGQWECLEMRYQMNTPGQADGIAQGWFNGNLAVSKAGLNFRSTSSLSIDNILFDTFFGGATPDYASPQNQYADFDNFVVGTQYIGCPE